MTITITPNGDPLPLGEIHRGQHAIFQLVDTPGLSGLGAITWEQRIIYDEVTWIPRMTRLRNGAEWHLEATAIVQPVTMAGN